MIPLLPLAPLGCKAIIYEDGDTHDSWASGDGTLDHPKTITAVICIMSLKHALTVSLD